MAKRALGPHALLVVQAAQAVLPAVREAAQAPAAPAVPATGDDRPEPAQLIVACSGGPDSLALAAAVAHIANRSSGEDPGVMARALVIDHGLQSETAAVATRVREQLEPRGLPVDIRRVSVPSGPGNSDGPEAAARHARHAAFDAATPAGATILLAHTLDDQAEQVLLGLARGSGTRSLAGIPRERDLPSGGRIARPLLDLRRTDTLAACEEWDLEPWFDPHNDDETFTRVRVRHCVLPTLEQHLGPGIPEALARTADQARDDADLADLLTDAHLVGNGLDPLPEALPVEMLNAHAAVTTRVLRRWLIARGADAPGYAHVHRVLRLVTHWRGQQEVQIPGLRVARAQGHLVAVRD